MISNILHKWKTWTELKCFTKVHTVQVNTVEVKMCPSKCKKKYVKSRSWSKSYNCMATAISHMEIKSTEQTQHTLLTYNVTANMQELRGLRFYS